jgi:PAS domain S-box-containing protein
MDLSRASPHLKPERDQLIERLMAAGSHDSPEDALRAAVARAEAEIPRAGIGNSQADERLATILDGIGDGLFALDREWRFIVVNRAAERYFGRPRETMLGQVIWDLFPWSYGTDLKARYERAMAERVPISFEGRSVAVPDRQLEIHLFPYEDGLGVSFRDWTDRHETEQALRASENRLRLALDAGRLAVWEYDVASGRLKPSPELNEVLGYPRSHVLDLDELRTRYFPGDQQRVQDAGQAAVASGSRFFQVEFRFRRPDGIYRWLLLRAEIVTGESGAIESIVGVLLDVDERRRIETALQESEARLAIATAAADLGIWDWDLASNEIVYSDRAKAIFGFSSDQTITLRDLRRATHPDDLRRTHRQACRALDPAIREKSPYEYRIVRPDGEIRWVIAHGEAVFGTIDGTEKALRYVGTIQDITARKRASADLRESEARLMALADNLPLGMVYQITAPEGGGRRFIYVSGNCERVIGVPAEAAIADPNRLYDLILPEFRDEMAAAEAAALREQRPFDIELAARHAATGEARWYRMIAAPRRLPGGELVWDGIQIDITDQKWAQEAVRRSEERLRTILDEMPVGVLLARMPTGEMVFSNAKSTELLGHPVDEIESIQDFARFGAIHPDGSPYLPHEYPIVRTVQHGEDIDQEEMLYRRGDGLVAHLAVSSTPVFSNPEMQGFAVCAFYDITERKKAEEHQSLLINELNHRVKNTLATVQSIAAQSFREAEASGEAGRVALTRAAFEARLFALARAHDVLTQENWESAGLRDIIDQAVAPYRGGVDYHVFITEGPNLRVTPQMALSLSMALHELCTNAVKYGALSRSGGHVHVSWSAVNDQERRLRLVWRERDGPPVAPPTRRGFGTRLIERGVARELGGQVTLSYDPEGLTCKVDVPLRHLPYET